jgi:hypothetical protein
LEQLTLDLVEAIIRKIKMVDDFKYYYMLNLDNQQFNEFMPFCKSHHINFGENSYNEKGEPVCINIEIIVSHMQEVVLTDYLFGPEVILHKRIVTEMQKLNMKGVKFIPAKLNFRDWNCTPKPMESIQIILPPLFNVPKETIIDDYFCIIAEENSISALTYEEFFNGDGWTNLPKVLDKKALEKIPLNERLCFYLPGVQPWQHTLFHHLVKDAINALNPTGLYFYDIEDKKD